MDVTKVDNYRDLLKIAVDARKSVDGRFSYSKLAAAAKIQKSYFSNVLSGRASLNSDQLYLLCKHLNLSTVQTDFALLLLEYDKTQVGERRRRLATAIEGSRSKQSKSEAHLSKSIAIETGGESLNDYYGHCLSPVVHMFMSIKKYRQNLNLIAEELHISSVELMRVLQILERCGLIQLDGDGYHYVDKNIHATADSLQAKLHAIQARLTAIDRNRVKRFDDDYFFTSSIATDEQGYAAIKQVWLAALEKISRIIADSKNERVYQLNLDCFRY